MSWESQGIQYYRKCKGCNGDRSLGERRNGTLYCSNCREYVSIHGYTNDHALLEQRRRREDIERDSTPCYVCDGQGSLEGYATCPKCYGTRTMGGALRASLDPRADYDRLCGAGYRPDLDDDD